MSGYGGWPTAKGFTPHRGGAYSGGTIMNLEIWLPTVFVLALAVLGLMFAFVIACEKV